MKNRNQFLTMGRKKDNSHPDLSGVLSKMLVFGGFASALTLSAIPDAEAAVLTNSASGVSKLNLNVTLNVSSQFQVVTGTDNIDRLEVTLTNNTNFGSETVLNGEILTGLFWDINDVNSSSLFLVDTTLAPGSSIVDNSNPPTLPVNGDYTAPNSGSAKNNAIAGTISQAAFQGGWSVPIPNAFPPTQGPNGGNPIDAVDGVLGNDTRDIGLGTVGFSTGNITGTGIFNGNAVGGGGQNGGQLNYGIVGSVNNINQINTDLPLVQNSLKFLLELRDDSGNAIDLPSQFDPNTDITDIYYAFGTGTASESGDQGIPVPGTDIPETSTPLSILGFGAIVALRAAFGKKKREHPILPCLVSTET
jgi:hypothetical protein